MNESRQQPSVLFVCMGNICRSPSAEGFFLRHLKLNGMSGAVHTDSAGTHSYHIGSPPDTRAIGIAAEFDVDITDLRARKVRERDFHDFDLIIAMDQGNLSTLRQFREMSSMGQGDADVRLMMEWSPQYEDQPEVPDPYYGGMADFRYMCELLDEATAGLLTQIREGDHGRGS
jgi:protein-tyrosine phosphatase